MASIAYAKRQLLLHKVVHVAGNIPHLTKWQHLPLNVEYIGIEPNVSSTAYLCRYQAQFAQALNKGGGRADACTA